MERLETQDPDKKKLIETSDRHKRELEREVRSIKEKSEQMVTNALIIGGSLVLTYIVIRQLSGSRAKRKKEKRNKSGEAESRQEEHVASAEPSLISQIGTKILNQATLMLLDIAKEQLVEYLESRKQRNENP